MRRWLLAGAAVAGLLGVAVLVELVLEARDDALERLEAERRARDQLTVLRREYGDPQAMRAAILNALDWRS